MSDNVTPRAPSLFRTSRGFYLALLLLIAAVTCFCVSIQFLPMRATFYLPVIALIGTLWCGASLLADGRHRGALRTLLAIGVALVLSLAYMGSYYVMLDGAGRKIQPISGEPPRYLHDRAFPSPHSWYASTFPVYRVDSIVVHAIFFPAHDVDRELHPNLWYW